MKSAVIVVDVQAGLFDTLPRPYEADEVVQRINHVTAKARAMGIPIIFIQTEHPIFLEYNSERWQLQSDLIVHKDDVFLRKSMANAFLETQLETILKSMGVDDLIICGYSTEFCIDSTLRYASALGYTIELIADAHTTHEKTHLTAKQIREHHNITLSAAPTVTALLSSDFLAKPLGQ